MSKNQIRTTNIGRPIDLSNERRQNPRVTSEMKHRKAWDRHDFPVMCSFYTAVQRTNKTEWELQLAIVKRIICSWEIKPNIKHVNNVWDNRRQCASTSQTPPSRTRPDSTTSGTGTIAAPQAMPVCRQCLLSLSMSLGRDCPRTAATDEPITTYVKKRLKMSPFATWNA